MKNSPHSLKTYYVRQDGAKCKFPEVLPNTGRAGMYTPSRLDFVQCNQDVHEADSHRRICDHLINDELGVTQRILESS